MKRSLALVLCLLTFAALAAGLATLIAPPPPVYSVDQLQAALRLQPRAWAGRVLTVRGVVVWVSYSFGPTPQGVSGTGEGACGPLPFFLQHPTRCPPMMRLTLAQIPSGSTVHLALASHPLYFPAAADTDPARFLRTHPTLALPLLLHSAPAPPDPLPPLLRRLRRLPLLPSLLPPPPLPLRASFSGLYRVRVVLPSPSARRPHPALELVVLGVS